mmetsp:Transcript_31658/g.51179  ORF Transcript_31658/g.51179 Transcript_31658/m.51179 type:complete len:82 (+) Transcript_31658:454-699(+)
MFSEESMYVIANLASFFDWKSRRTNASSYSTSTPKSTLQTIGCGRTKGPRGNTKAPMVRMKQAAARKAVNVFFIISSLEGV